MSSRRKTFSLIGLSFTLVTLLGFVLPGITLAEKTCPGPVTKTAEVVAIDHAIFFNRMGAYNPGGMIYALRRDVVDDNVPPNPIGSYADAAAKLEEQGHSP